MSRDIDRFSRHLISSAEDTDSIISVGYDPAPVNFPLPGISGYDSNLPNPIEEYDNNELSEYLIRYFREFLEYYESSECKFGCFKANLGYFQMYDQNKEHPGMDALAEILELMKEVEQIPVILDVKDADIARSSATYAISKLKLENVDAITVHPYMGTDSVEPFFKFAHERGQGIYVLTRTTNPGANDFQELDIYQGGATDSSDSDRFNKLYIEVAKKILEWSESYPGTVGSVVAGNNPTELREIASYFAQKDVEIPLLIPGVGTQGGEVTRVMKALDKAGYNHQLARINSSSGVMYRAQKDGRANKSHAVASTEEIERLNEQIELRSYLE